MTALWRRVDGRVVVAAALACYLAVVLGLAAFRDGIEDWSLLGVPAEQQRFIDMASITSAWECDRAGIDVVPENPCDPLGRPANYPSIVVGLSFLGLGTESTVVLGLANAVVFLAAAFLLMGRVGRGAGLLWALLLCSPAVMLGLERGNVDLFLFALCVAAVPLLRARKLLPVTLGHGLLVVAAVAKLFPAFGLLVLGRQPRFRAFVGAGAAALLLGAYAAWTRDEIRDVFAAVPQFTDLSYGVSVAVDVLALHYDVFQKTSVSLGLQLGAAVVAIGTAVGLGLRRATDRSGDDRAIGALWLGAAIFAGTFFALNNWNYRLVFVLLCVPTLLRWRSRRDPPLPHAGLALVVLVLVLWLSAPVPLVPLGPSGIIDAWDVVAFEEILGWILAVYLLTAVVATPPVWARGGGDEISGGAESAPPARPRAGSPAAPTAVRAGRSGRTDAR